MMTAILYRGNKEAGKINARTAADISRLRMTPSLGIIMTQNEPGQIRFTKYKKQAAQDLGIACEIIQADHYNSTDDFIKIVKKTAAEFTGILIQLPLPSHIDKIKVLNAIPYEKDVEGLSRSRVGTVYQNIPTLYSPAAMAVVAAIDCAATDTGIDLRGRAVVIVGNSYLIGQPVSQVLFRKETTVTLCGKHTKNLGEYTQKADILVSCTGKTELISADMVNPNSIVIDAGFEIDQSGQISGDVDPAAARTASFFTPVPGGIGPVTIAFIYHNLINLARNISQE